MQSTSLLRIGRSLLYGHAQRISCPITTGSVGALLSRLHLPPVGQAAFTASAERPFSRRKAAGPTKTKSVAIQEDAGIPGKRRPKSDAIVILPVSAHDWTQDHFDFFVGETVRIDDYKSFFGTDSKDDLQGLPETGKMIKELEVTEKLKASMMKRQFPETLDPVELTFVRRLAAVLYYNKGVEAEAQSMLYTLLLFINFYDRSIIDCFKKLSLQISPPKEFCLIAEIPPTVAIRADPDMVFMTAKENIIFFCVEVKPNTYYSGAVGQALAEAFAVAHHNWRQGKLPYDKDQELHFCIQTGTKFGFYKMTVAYDFIQEYVLKWTKPPKEKQLVVYRLHDEDLDFLCKDHRSEIIAALLHQKKKPKPL